LALNGEWGTYENEKAQDGNRKGNRDLLKLKDSNGHHFSSYS